MKVSYNNQNLTTTGKPLIETLHEPDQPIITKKYSGGKGEVELNSTQLEIFNKLEYILCAGDRLLEQQRELGEVLIRIEQKLEEQLTYLPK